MKTLGERIKHYRKLRGIGQAELGKLVGLDQTVVSKLENGTTEETGKVAHFAKALMVDAYWLATGEGLAEPFYPQTTEGILAAKAVDGMHAKGDRQMAVKVIDTLSKPSEGTNGDQ